MSDPAQHTSPIAIIGGGPSGLAAAIYLARADLAPVVFAGSPPGGQLMLTTEVENFPGQNGVMGPDLIEKMRAQAVRFGTVLRDENVTKVDFTKKTFRLTTLKREQSFRAVIIATGARAQWLGLPSEERLRGKGVSACATCDGFFFRGKTIAVIGGGDSALEEALTLTKFAKKVYIIHRRDSFRASKIMQERVLKHPQIEVVWNAKTEEITGTVRVEGVRLTIGGKERVIPLEGVFVAIGHKPDTGLFAGQIELDAKGYVMTSDKLAQAYLMGKEVSPERLAKTRGESYYGTATSRPGVFASGDCVDHVYRQATTAAGLGVAASLDAERWLESQ